MADPYFWLRRPSDDSWHPVTEFSGATSQVDTDGSPFSIPDIEPGDYALTVSNGQNGQRLDVQEFVVKDAVGRLSLTPVLNGKVGFTESNPAVRVNGTDYAGSQIGEGDLENDVSGTFAFVQNLYDQAGENDLTPPSSSDQPVIVSGDLIRDDQGRPAFGVDNGRMLERSRPEGPVTVGTVIELQSTDEDVLYVNGISLSSDGTDLRAHVNEAVVSSATQSVTDASSAHRGTFNLSGTLYRFTRPNGTDTAMYEWTGSDWTELFGEFDGANQAGNNDTFPIAYNDKIFVGDGTDLWAWAPSDGTAGFQQVGTNVLPSGADFRAKYVFSGTLYLHDNDSDPGVTTYDGSTFSRSDPGVPEVFVQDAIVYDGRAYLLDGDSGTVQVKSWVPGDTTSWTDETTITDPSEFYTYNGNLYLAGDSLKKYDSTSWSTVSTPFGGPVSSGIEADEVMWVIAETTAGQNDWKLYIYDGEEWRSFADPVDAGGLQSRGGFEVIYNSEVFYFLISNGGYTAQASYTQRNRSTTVSVPLPSDPLNVVLGTDGSTIALRAGGQEATATYSFERNDNAHTTLGGTSGTIRHYTEFNSLLSQSDRNALESALGTQ